MLKTEHNFLNLPANNLCHRYGRCRGKTLGRSEESLARLLVLPSLPPTEDIPLMMVGSFHLF